MLVKLQLQYRPDERSYGSFNDDEVKDSYRLVRVQRGNTVAPRMCRKLTEELLFGCEQYNPKECTFLLYMCNTPQGIPPGCINLGPWVQLGTTGGFRHAACMDGKCEDISQDRYVNLSVYDLSMKSGCCGDWYYIGIHILEEHEHEPA